MSFYFFAGDVNENSITASTMRYNDQLWQRQLHCGAKQKKIWTPNMSRHYVDVCVITRTTVQYILYLYIYIYRYGYILMYLSVAVSTLIQSIAHCVSSAVCCSSLRTLSECKSQYNRAISIGPLTDGRLGNWGSRLSSTIADHISYPIRPHWSVQSREIDIGDEL